MNATLSESEFDRLADSTLNGLLDALSDVPDAPFEVDLESGVLTIRFEDGTRYVVNSHRAARQIWAAAESTAWHFEWENSAWISTKTREELRSVVERTVSKKSGRTLGVHRS